MKKNVELALRGLDYGIPEAVEQFIEAQEEIKQSRQQQRPEKQRMSKDDLMDKYND